MDEKSMKKSFSGLGLRFLIGTLIIYAVQIAVVGVVGMVKPEWLENTTINLILAVLPLYLIGMPVLIALVKQMPGEAPVKKSMKPGHEGDRSGLGAFCLADRCEPLSAIRGKSQDRDTAL